MSEVVKNHWGFIVALLLAVVLAGFYIFGNFIDNYDAAGHRIMIDSMHNFWPLPIGWDNSTFLGHMYGEAYPMFMHWLMTGLSFIFGTDLSVKLFVGASIILLPISINWYLGKSSSRSLSLLFVIAAMLILPGYIGSSLSGLFTYGLIPAFTAMPVFFALLGCLKRIGTKRKFAIWSAILFALLIWSHLIVAMAAGAFIIAQLLVKNSNENSNRIWVVLAAGTLAGTPLLIATIASASSTIQSASGLSTLVMVNVPLFAICLLLVFKLKLWGKSIEARAAIIILGFLCLTPILMKLSSFSLIHHAYRLQLFAYVFAGLFIIDAVKISKKHVKLVSVMFLIGFVALSAYKVRDFLHDEVTVTINKPVNGRFIESFRRSESFPAPYAGQQRLVASGGQWSNGLFSETAPNAPFIQSLMKSLRPQAYEDLGYGIDEVIKSPDDTQELLSLFGISHVLSLNDDKSGSIGSLTTNGNTLYYHDQDLGSVSMAETIDPNNLKPISNNWDSAVKQWWRDDVNDYLYDASAGKITATKPATSVDVIEYSRSKIVIDINSDQAAPVIIKETFNTKWRAVDSEGKNLQIYVFSPFLMMVEAKGKVTLTI